MGAEPDEVLHLAIDLVRLGAALGTGLAERSGLHSSDVRALQVLDAAAPASFDLGFQQVQQAGFHRPGFALGTGERFSEHIAQAG